jgi:hypothetical protein
LNPSFFQARQGPSITIQVLSASHRIIALGFDNDNQTRSDSRLEWSSIRRIRVDKTLFDSKIELKIQSNAMPEPQLNNQHIPTISWGFILNRNLNILSPEFNSGSNARLGVDN